MKYCNSCEYTDNLMYTSLPPQVKCTITGEFHYLSEKCNVKFEPVRLGRWEDTYNDGNWHCSECGAIVEKDEQDRHFWRRCYHCGAVMVSLMGLGGYNKESDDESK